MATRRIRQSIRAERGVRGGREISLELRADTEGANTVPAIFLLPDTPRPAPAALLIHGYTSRKEHMIEMAGAILLERGIAALAVDLPLHGERKRPLQAQAMWEPMQLLRSWRDGLDECALALRYLAARSELDRSQLAVVGYSLGSFIGVTVAADAPSVSAVVLAAGGDLPADTPFEALIRTVADPLRAVRKLSGRPLLMVNGRQDRTIRADQARRLFDAAQEPKEIRWWDAGHHLPPEAIAAAADWLAARLGRAERRRSG